ncbi:MAG: hypothetical protein EPO26_15905 [Chloroflexota bacterium]|nr:MAG: hypothetical protein EPO26_15905 [Chloroflexota bacterium]
MTARAIRWSSLFAVLLILALDGCSARSTPMAPVGPEPEKVINDLATPTTIVTVAATPLTSATGVAVATVAVRSTPAPWDDPEGELIRVLSTDASERDSVRLAREFNRIASVAPTDPTAPSRQFWVSDPGRRAIFSIEGRLFRRSTSVDVWNQDGQTIDAEGLDRSVTRFESVTRPKLARGLFPSLPLAEFERLAIVNARVGGVIGYFSSSNEHPPGIVRSGNSLAMILMSLQNARPGSDVYDAGLAHEFTHLMQWRADRAEETWVSEGTAEYAIATAGLGAGGSRSAFLRAPRTQLNHWAERLENSPAHYGAAELFFTFAADRLGGDAFVADVIVDRGRGLAAIDAIVRRRGPYGSVDDLIADWMAHNYGNRYGRLDYVSGNVMAVAADPVAPSTTVTVPQYSAHYVALTTYNAGSTVEVRFAPTVRLVGAPARPTPFWWARRGDGIESRLTRAIDLRQVSSATLRFSIWHDLEEDFDYGFVSGSIDGGVSWTTLRATTTRTSDPNDANLGHGFTGATPGWVSETVELAPLVGRLALIRFHVVTDDSYSGAGLCIADAEVPEIGWRDVPDDGDWTVEGFARVANRMPQRVRAVIVVPGDAAPTVITLVPTDPGRLFGRVPALLAGQRAALIVAPLTPVTLEPATITITVAAP